MWNYRYYLTVLIVFTSFQLTISQEIYFSHLSSKDGLSHIAATSLHQDQLGRIWIGTRDGLNCYDGVQISTFRPIRGDSTSMLGHIVMNIQQQGSYIWVLTNSGLSQYNTRSSKFKRFPLVGVNTFLLTKDGILLGTNNGLFELDTIQKMKIKAPGHPSEDYNITSLLKDHNNKLWVGTMNDGLFRINNSTYKHINKVTGTITSLFEDSQFTICVGTQQSGIYFLSANEIKHFKSLSTKNSIVHNFVRDINEDLNGKIWIGTFLGLSIYDKEKEAFATYQQSDENPYGISHNSIFSLLKDSQGTMWVGTYFGGVNYFNPDYYIYNHYRPKNNKKSISYRVIGTLVEDYKNNIWIATEGGGLNYFDRSSNKFTHYIHSDHKNSISHNNIKDIYLEGKNTVYIGTFMGGLNRLDLQTGKFRNYINNPANPKSIPSNVVNTIIPWNRKYLLGTHAGVILFDQQKEEFTPFFKDHENKSLIGSNIFCIKEDSHGFLWIGTEKGGGLIRYNPKTKELKRYQFSENDPRSIGNNTVYQIFEDNQFRIWIATLGGGLNLFHPETDDFTSYTHNKYNIPSNIIYGIQESRFGNLWITTSKGLCRLDIENNRFFTYDASNGFPLTELSEGSILLTNEGQLFVGGMNGMISFDEKDLLKKPKSINLIFSELSVNNEIIYPNQANGILKNTFPYTSKITLNSEHTVFSIQYAACNFISTNKHLYQYKLSGVDKDWVNAGYKTSVSYTNLNPGLYSFKVRGVDIHHHTILAEKELTIKVNPPFYLTWYAYLFYSISIVSIIVWINRFYLTKARLVDQLNAEQQEKLQIKELNQSKLRFFTNISHEFRTPLTLILGSLETILNTDKINSKFHASLLSTYKNAVRLNGLIIELLDFRRLEQGHLNIKVSELDIIHFLEEIFQSFSELASHKGITYEFIKPNYPVILWFDPLQMEKVFYNILSNAFKFTNTTKGIILLKIETEIDEVLINISDNGNGIPSNELDKIFDRFYQINNLKDTNIGSGIGLTLSKGIIEKHKGNISATSTENRGSNFSVKLKKGNQHFTKDQVAKSLTQKTNSKEFDFANKSFNLENKNIDFSASQARENVPKLLIVEDDKEIREMLSGIFIEVFNILTAKDGEEGFTSALKHQPDLIISDIMMPIMSGNEMCIKIKRNIVTSHIPVILLTARTANESIIEGLETGADDYITKPFNVLFLKTRAINLLRNRKKLQEKYSKSLQGEIKELATTSIDKKLLNKAQQVIDKHIDNSEFDVNQFASEMGLGRTRLYSKIKGITGQTPNDYILTYRLKKAAEKILNHSEMNISEIAYSVGFGTPKYFSRCFREHFGVSPSMYGKTN